MIKFGTKAPKAENPALLDRIIGNVQDGLIANLPWLDVAFGRAERLVKLDNDKRRIYTPCIYYRENDYVELTPDSRVGNFSFFWINDPQAISTEPHVSLSISATFALIFWFDYRKVFNDASIRNREEIKQQILDVLNGGFWLKHGSLQVNKIYELAENIYRGFSLDEIDNQFLMHPYGGFRFEGQLSIGGKCKL